jgi:cytochrome c-type biogenesis protein CcmH/NrfG
VRRYSTAIVIVTAVVLATVIVVATSMSQSVDETAPEGTATAPPTDHRIAQVDGLSGTVDVAAAERSVDALERARAANPGNVRVILNLGDAYAAARRFDDAEAAYEDALDVSPGHPNGAVGLAMVWHARGEDDRAVRLLERVLGAFPDHQQAQYDLALVCFSRQEVAAAREAWVKAAAIDPTSELGRASQDFVELLSDGESAP